MFKERGKPRRRWEDNIKNEDIEMMRVHALYLRGSW
jgi:hypothetical protein